MAIKDLIGQKFGRFTVLEFDKVDKGSYYWKCVCECGNHKNITSSNLLRGTSKSCGCLKKELAKTKKREMCIEDLSGKKFNRLTIIGFDKRSGSLYYWKCRCDCGKIKSVQANALKIGRIKSCGCLNRELSAERGRNQFTKHGLKNHSIYKTRTRMITRCYNPKSDKFHYYGGRGIAVCEEWRDSFEAFYLWAISNGWQEGLTIERKNVNGNYSPENCCWIPFSEQAKNKRNTIKVS